MNTQELTTITETNFDNIIQEIDKAFYDIPFENSQFQTENFVIGNSITPERAYRNIGLRMSNRLRALEEARYNLEKENIDIEELQEKINDPTTDKYDKRRFQLDIEHKINNRSFTSKLINDALIELNVLYAHFKSLPKYTREEFEAGEQQHFTAKLERQLGGISGAAESLTNMTDYKDIVQYIEQYQQLLDHKNSD